MASDRPAKKPVRKWVVRTVLAASMAGALLLVFHRPLLVSIASAFRVHDPAPSDALVLLMGQWDSRAVGAARLYDQGVAPVILMGSTAPHPEPDLCESALNRAVLLRSGVPADAIRVLGEPNPVTSTRDEALRVLGYLRAHPARRITVVTTSFHTARSRWVFRKVLKGAGVDVRMAAIPDPRFDESNWYTNVDGMIEYTEEALKAIVYRLAY
jgi:uncharacterized SAM-binding protein YcdF (DUF218 family)